MDRSATRRVAHIAKSERVQVAPGFFVRRGIPADGVEMVDPWLMLDHFGPLDIAPGEASGVPDHPHRGFEPITYLIEGENEHRDSAGNHIVVRSGDVNWMTAGSGIVHSEMPPEAVKRTGGRMHGFQVWLNLPGASKMVTPRVQHVSADHVPSVAIGAARVKIIAGELLGIRSPIETHTPVAFYHVTIPAGAETVIPIPAEFAACVYVAQGAGWVGAAGKAIHAGELAVFAGEELGVALGADATGPLDALLLGGVPLGEPVFSYGPFVMNTRQEIIQAIDDYNRGSFGEIRVA